MATTTWHHHQDPEENPSSKRERIAIAASYRGRSERIRDTGVSVFPGEWHAETSGHVRGYIHLGSRERAGADTLIGAPGADLGKCFVR